jgi:hypothetical protein
MLADLAADRARLVGRATWMTILLTTCDGAEPAGIRGTTGRVMVRAVASQARNYRDDRILA